MKPNSKNTLYWVQVSLMTIAAEVSPPEGTVINWLMQGSTTVSLHSTSSVTSLDLIPCEAEGCSRLSIRHPHAQDLRSSDYFFCSNHDEHPQRSVR